MASFTSAFAGQALPLRSPQRALCSRSSRGFQVQAILSKPREGSLDVDEQELNGTDAFQQLVALSRKQSVNRPQRVRANFVTFGSRTWLPS